MSKEEIIDAIINYEMLPFIQPSHVAEIVDFVIQNTKSKWKPSENKLKVLKLAAEKDGTCLMGLYEQLKKLKEE